MVKVFASFCPLSADCKKGGKRLGTDADAETARKRIVNHLMYSPYHSLAADEAEVQAQGADLLDEDVDDAEWTNREDREWQSWSGADSKGSGKSSGKSWRSQPYADKGSGKSSGKGSGKASSSHDSVSNEHLQMQLANAAAAANIREQLITSAARCEAGTRAASRMARQAWMAFEEEANGLLALINELRGTGDPIRF